MMEIYLTATNGGYYKISNDSDLVICFPFIYCSK